MMPDTVTKLVLEILDSDLSVRKSVEIDIDEDLALEVFSRNDRAPMRLRARVVRSMTLGETQMRPYFVES